MIQPDENMTYQPRHSQPGEPWHYGWAGRHAQHCAIAALALTAAVVAVLALAGVIG